jgi:hypothetical protein
MKQEQIEELSGADSTAFSHGGVEYWPTQSLHSRTPIVGCLENLDSALSVAMRNALPTLLREREQLLGALRAERDRLLIRGGDDRDLLRVHGVSARSETPSRRRSPRAWR